MFGRNRDKALDRIACALERITKILARVFPGPAVAAKLLIGGKPVSTNAFSLTDIQQASYQVAGLDEDNNPTPNVPTGASLVVTSSDLTIVAVVPDPTPAPGAIGSGQLVAAGKTGTASVSFVVNDAGGNPLFIVAGSPVSVGVGPSAATSAGVTFGTPTIQPGK